LPARAENTEKVVAQSPNKVETKSNDKLLPTSKKLPTKVEQPNECLPVQPENTDKPCADKAVEREKPKLSHDWYQTETSVVVEVRAKGLKASDVIVDVSEAGLAVNIKLDGGREYVLDLRLAHPIVAEQVINPFCHIKY
jgi:HSP20 family molecular chaperone IbpA